MKLCSKMVEAGQAYSAANQLFLSGLAELSMYQKKDAVITNCLNQFNQGLQEMVNDDGLVSLRFLPQLVETRREFVRIGEDLETAAVKNAQVSRHKAGDAERASHLLLATRKCYQHFALDYCLQLNTFKTQQKIDILNSVFSFVHAQFTFFHQGFDLLRDLEPTMKTTAAQLSQLSTECAAKRKDLENSHLLVQQRVSSSSRLPLDSRELAAHCNTLPVCVCVCVCGYLFKRSRRKTKTWKRCWFSIRDNQLIYRKSHKNVVLFEDLRLCAVKSLENVDRRFCFELLSVQKCCALQADSDQLKQAWLSALQGSIDLAYRERPKELPPLLGGGDSSPGPPAKRQAALGVALRGPGNHRCCDCGEEEPRWASINLGVTMCIECSGIHRSLGVHLSKVRSLTLDSWEAEQLKLLCVLGNDVINQIYEAKCSEEGGVKPRPDKSWIKEKYVEKRFVQNSSSDGEFMHSLTLQLVHSDLPYSTVTVRSPFHQSDGTKILSSRFTDESCVNVAQVSRRRSVSGGGKDSAALRLYRAALAGDLVAMAAALAHGAEVNGSIGEEEGRTALIGAAVGGSLSACEFLLLNGANVNHRDLRGRGALHAAATAGHTGQVCLLLKRGANQYAADERGQDPLAIAVETANADIVTLLRMARMNEEMRDSEGVFGAVGDDETFQDIFRDFSDMASHDPERLSRRQFGRGGDEEEEEEGGGRMTNSRHGVEKTS
uniref:Arf-GAP with coiled-coil, ANK repeat and PH domain-containing protein n=1 Tax=Dicentrarchus labrax TaxID=13489 RepID=A0A8C4D600_DICLA